MLRWLVRLLIVGAIVGVAAFVAQKLLNQDDDFDDFDDLDETFEFQETPVEIEVPASDAGGSTMSGAASAYSSGGQDEGRGGEGEGGEEPTGPGLIDVKGIGSAFASRLNAVGINSLEDLAAASAETLNEQLDVPGGVGTLEDWIGQAKELASSGSSSSNGVSDQ
jgi:predicted flap endonuclease-1-like 5' DNA nuclease